MNAVERVTRLGPGGELVGILHVPAAAQRRPGALLLLNAGLLHHVGPSRLYVRIARAAAAAGVPTLRLDLPGVGDSAPRARSEGTEADVAWAMRLALDALCREAGEGMIAAGGLCSASDTAFRHALDDERISALFQLDPWVHPTLGYDVRRFGSSLLRPRSWATALSKAMRIGRADVDDEAASSAIDPTERPFPERSWVAAGYGRLVARGVRIMAIFSGMRWHYCQYANQLLDAYPEVTFGDLLELHRIDGAEHLFLRESDQRVVVHLMHQWSIGLGGLASTRASGAASTS